MKTPPDLIKSFGMPKTSEQLEILIQAAQSDAVAWGEMLGMRKALKEAQMIQSECWEGDREMGAQKVCSAIEDLLDNKGVKQQTVDI